MMGKMTEVKSREMGVRITDLTRVCLRASYAQLAWSHRLNASVHCLFLIRTIYRESPYMI
jgi:hypothetical protein